MDKGAHFYRCDFQVHSPRDINWNGNKYVSDADRKEYSETFIQHCRLKGLGAVAITDHHDFAFFKFIKQAAVDEVDSQGTAIIDEKKLSSFRDWR